MILQTGLTTVLTTSRPSVIDQEINNTYQTGPGMQLIVADDSAEKTQSGTIANTASLST